MLTLGNFTVFLLFAAVAAWLWHSHGIREHALVAVQRYCKKMDIELLDGNVAFRRLGWVRDARGHRRFARVYGFEFTVTGEQRHQGSISMFGMRAGPIETDAHPFPAQATPSAEQGRVFQMDDWRNRND